MADISVIIPTRNRATLLLSTIESIACQESPSSHEILVVDNGSNDDTPVVVQEAKARFKCDIRYIWEAVPGLLSGRHRGAAEAAGSLLVFVDDDIQALEGWLASISLAFEDPEVLLVGGPSTASFETPPPSWLDEFWVEDEAGRRCDWISAIDLGSRPKLVHPNLVWGLNMSMRRSLFDRLQGFHPDNMPLELQHFQGDGETGLTEKAHASGVSALFHPQVHVRHRIPSDRTTLPAAERRAFYQGICDSFTAIRRGGSPTSMNFLGRLKKRLDRRSTGPQFGRKRSRVNGLVQEAYTKGYRFHHTAVELSPRLLEWVLRPHYLDYRLPELEPESARRIADIATHGGQAT